MLALPSCPVSPFYFTRLPSFYWTLDVESSMLGVGSWTFNVHSLFSSALIFSPSYLLIFFASWSIIRCWELDVRCSMFILCSPLPLSSHLLTFSPSFLFLPSLLSVPVRVCLWQKISCSSLAPGYHKSDFPLTIPPKRHIMTHNNLRGDSCLRLLYGV